MDGSDRAVTAVSKKFLLNTHLSSLTHRGNPAMAISTSFSSLPSPRTQLLSSSSLGSHRLVSTFLPSTLPRESKRLLSYQPRCRLLSTAIPQRFLRTEDLKEELIRAISEEMSSIEKGGSAESLHEALKLVDLIQRLGIQRFFKLQIDRILKSAYMWLDEQWLEEFPFPRNRLPKLFIGVAMTMYEPQFSFYRATVTKISCHVAAMDDLFDSPTSDYQGLCRLQEAFQSWDTSPVENLPQHKAIFKSYQQNLTGITSVASTAQGRDVLPYIKEVWQDLVSVFTIEAEWRLSSHVPSLQDYLPVAVTSVTAIACLSTFILILGEPITDETLRFIGKDSRFLYLASLISRLANDVATNESEEAEGKLCNAVGCYMEDHPECTKEDAIMAIKEMIKASFREMEQVMFMCRGTVPECCIRAVLGWVQAICISYRKLDGYKSTMDTEYEELVKDYMGC